jgi:hypothetical protein
VSDETHYAFPPASAYRINRCLYAIKSDAEYCARFLADPAAAMAEIGVSDDERLVLNPIDRDALVGRGAHPYLVFMADLRLRMTREPGSLEHF